MTAQEWCFVSDLHLDLDRDPRGGGDRFAAFLDAFVGEGPDRQRHLVLLGDVFELGARVGRPGARLAQLAVRHPRVFASLARAVRAGTTVHLVCGNHDLELAGPEVWAALLWSLDLEVGDRARVRLHPWFLHVPGVCYAEHGHQHHELNRSPAMLDHTRTGAVVPPALVPAWAGADGPVWRRLTRMAAAARAVGAQERRAASSGYAPLLEEVARDEGLLPEVVHRLHQASRPGLVRGSARTAQRVVRRRAGLPGSDFLARPAATVSRILREAGQPVPVVVFGHTHRAGVVVTSEGTSYANCGTWCSDVRGEGPDAVDPGIFPAVRLRAGPTGVRVALQWWSDADRLRPRPGAGDQTKDETRREPCIPTAP